MKSEVLS